LLTDTTLIETILNDAAGSTVDCHGAGTH
jgi:hypothetical protein